MGDCMPSSSSNEWQFNAEFFEEEFWRISSPPPLDDSFFSGSVPTSEEPNGDLQDYSLPQQDLSLSPLQEPQVPKGNHHPSFFQDPNGSVASHTALHASTGDLNPSGYRPDSSFASQPVLDALTGDMNPWDGYPLPPHNQMPAAQQHWASSSFSAAPAPTIGQDFGFQGQFGGIQSPNLGGATFEYNGVIMETQGFSTSMSVSTYQHEGLQNVHRRPQFIFGPTRQLQPASTSAIAHTCLHNPPQFPVVPAPAPADTRTQTFHNNHTQFAVPEPAPVNIRSPAFQYKHPRVAVWEPAPANIRSQTSYDNHLPVAAPATAADDIRCQTFYNNDPAAAVPQPAPATHFRRQAFHNKPAQIPVPQAAPANTRRRRRPRARRGQARDPHSMTERVRRENISDGIKSLHELVPNATKADRAGTLDQIISYIRLIQNQVKEMSGDRVEENDQEREESEENKEVEKQLLRLLESDMSGAVQFLRSKGHRLMPVSLVASIAACKGVILERKKARLADSDGRNSKNNSTRLMALLAGSPKPT